MSDIMRPISFPQLMEWILTEHKNDGAVFGVKKLYRAKSGKTMQIFGETMEIPFGPAAGPHTQLAQNLVASYVAGSRFFELKTVQILDGHDLPVSKPCISAPDECYNVEWSTELRVPEAMDEYVKGWFALKLISKEFELGSPDGFVFNMSVGYDLEGIKTPKIDNFIEGLKDASNSAVWAECRKWAMDNLSRFSKVDAAFVDSITPKVCRSITLSTLHGCPPDEIERIASYLLTEKKVHTYIKCNPTLLGYEYARKTLDNLGFDYVSFTDHHFKADLQFEDAVPMLRRLQELAASKNLAFGVKLTNTFPVKITAGELPGEEMYMSGRSLFPLSMSVAAMLSKAFDGKLPISYSGGADIYNIAELLDAGIWPITIATTLLKPGGYQRLYQLAEKLEGCPYKPLDGVDVTAVQAIVDNTAQSPLYRKPIKPAPLRKMSEHVPLTDCFAAPCREGCPIKQDIPAYMRLAEQGKYLEALEVIIQRNPLPFITGTICSHRCMDKCTRNFYEEPIYIRSVKLESAEGGYGQFMSKLQKPALTKEKVAIIGGGAAGLAAAYFLAKAGHPVTIFEKRSALGGIVKFVIPEFRISDEAIDNDIALIQAMGVEIKLNAEVKSVEELKSQGFNKVIVATGAWKPGKLELQGGKAMNVLEFLEQTKYNPDKASLGENVVLIGGGNTAMDAARAAKRVEGVKNVYLVYRRTKRYMPADEEELALAIEDGVEFRELLAPQSLENGVLRSEKMKLGDPDASGRRSPVATGETVDIPADTVIAAVGEKVDSEFYAANSIATNKWGEAEVDANLQTSVQGVYVIGDACRGPATVVEAIADAIRCVQAIADVDVNKYEDHNLNPDPTIPRDKKGELCTCEMCHEYERCLECSTVCECCVDVCPNRANLSLLVDGRPQILHVDYMCNECGNCETFCPYSSAPYKHKFTLFANTEDFEDSENQGFLPLEGGKAMVRLDGKAGTYALSELPTDVAALIAEACKHSEIIYK